ncbi:MAG: hypothetical protein J6V09_00690 [Clostridia bacterium]|nr:hypothetical protein [Clostridia bacterium]
MKLDKEKLKQMAEKSDDALWAEIYEMAKAHGYTLPKAAPKHEDMERIRGAMRGSEKITLGDAARIMNSCKKMK